MKNISNYNILYRPEIDGLRAIAVIGVIFYHSQISFLSHNLLAGGFFGVDIFFVISGYIISSIILNEKKNTNNFSYKSFYERRVRRIVPILLLIILLSIPFAYIYFIPQNFLEFIKQTLSSIIFFSNIYFYNSKIEYDATESLEIPHLHTWSLSVEEQFYILFPALFLVSYFFLKKKIKYLFCLIILLSLGFTSVISEQHASFNFMLLLKI